MVSFQRVRAAEGKCAVDKVNLCGWQAARYGKKRSGGNTYTLHFIVKLY